jgi:hypothetical protein
MPRICGRDRPRPGELASVFEREEAGFSSRENGEIGRWGDRTLAVANQRYLM